MSQVNRTIMILCLCFAALAAGCSDRNKKSIFSPDMGHPENWVANHGREYLAVAGACVECHGKELKGGISKVSCFSESGMGLICHPGGPESLIHPDGWEDPAQHGKSANDPPGPTSGLAFCRLCHGEDFSGGVVKSACSACHVAGAPHPAGRWTGGRYSHTKSDRGNAAVCGVCHLRASTTGVPDCFNNTLCHGQRGVHPGGWGDPAAHGPTAKAAPGGNSGFEYCRQCHGSGYGGGASGISCFPCHGVQAPHSPAPWLGGRYTHDDTAGGNAAACDPCHRDPAASPGALPGCFNNTLCHGPEGNPHPPGWEDPDLHGPPAKGRPGAARGFGYCQVCHGSNFTGGTSGLSCFDCHGVRAPHPPGPWRDGRTHEDTRPGNAEACAVCHRRPFEPEENPSGCYNDTLCHGDT